MGFKNGMPMKSWATAAPPKQEALPNNLDHRGATCLEGPSMKDSLLRMIGRITPNIALRQDLLQEALIHLWLTETRRPGQTRSWYLQSSKFHLLHYLASGRSVDSTKRGRGHSRYDEDCVQPEEFPQLVEPGDSVLSQVIAWDIISLLSPHLSPRELAVLDGLADGLGVREIGRRLEMSHTMVLKHRSKIASLLVELERPSIQREPLRRARPAGDRNQANGVRYADPAKPANGVKWPIGLQQPSHTNGDTRPGILSAGAIPSWEFNGFLKPARNLDLTAKRC